jgi:NADH:ubiquinone oxidoreductase subunit K
MIPQHHILIFTGLLFSLGLFGVLFRRNLLIVLMSIELMLNSVNVNLVAFGGEWAVISGQMMALFVMVVAAAEVTVGLALAVALFRFRGSLNLADWSSLKG